MERIWLKQYPAGVPADIDVTQYSSLVELLDWFVKRKAWNMIDEVATRFSASFEFDAVLTYTLCEARLAEGKKELADHQVEHKAQIHLRLDSLKGHLDEHAAAHATSATMCTSSGPVRTGIRSPRWSRRCSGVTSKPDCADSHGKRAPSPPWARAARIAAGSRLTRYSSIARAACGWVAARKGRT